MKVRIGNLEVSDITPDELDELVKRYGGSLPDAPAEFSGRVTPPPANGGKVPAGTTAQDATVLKSLIEAGTGGVLTGTLGELLGKRGRGTRGALRRWSQRIGLNSDENLDTFEECRVGTQRGIRLKSSFLEVAKSLSTSR
jgi:hypothetical protein